ncbi:ArsR/SmtB family transcription factor [Micromonospora sp. NPDC002575]|uniref:ArsR/SmtB family transcription factor n=1 Tax=Micromonospora sp. NPDC002575 TaxID=3364222 RepID=UPI0036B81F01
MSKQASDLTAAPCCAPLTRRRVPTGAAVALAPAFKALGDPVRLQLLSMIASAEGGEICVCDLTPAFDLTGPTISHHLRVLREAGLVDAERRGTWVWYRARPAMLGQLAVLLTVEPAASEAEAAPAAGTPRACA